MFMVHIKEVAGTEVVVSRLSPANADLQSRMFNLPWHFLLLPKITLLFSRSQCVLAALDFCRVHCCSPVYFGNGRCKLGAKEEGGKILVLIS